TKSSRRRTELIFHVASLKRMMGLLSRPRQPGNAAIRLSPHFLGINGTANAYSRRRFWGKERGRKEKGVQPLSGVGRLSAFFARAGREAGSSRPHLRLDGGALPIQTMWSASATEICSPSGDFKPSHLENLTIGKDLEDKAINL
ncbi:MAG: hypothetical protein WBV18_02000, partial [Methyloceanibacter sp.]|uniref:hypothetical protein n=1 Tax=Methyloceanibacter sp. TaxID=1965321 RepID=UPI003C63E73A